MDPSLRDRIRDLRIDLPDDPTVEQVDAWIELAELVQDPGFRTRIRAFFEHRRDLPRPEIADFHSSLAAREY